MNSGIRCLAALFLLAAVTSCSLFETKTSDIDLQPVNTKELKDLLNSKKGPTLLLDVRIARKFAQGHLPGAVNIPLPELVANDQRLANATNIVVYSSGWTDYLGTAGAKRLMALGYKNVFNYRGGVELWTSEGNAVEKDATTASQPAGK